MARIDGIFSVRRCGGQRDAVAALTERVCPAVGEQRLRAVTRVVIDSVAVITPLVIDCDTGIDDSLALLYALAHSEVDLLAVLSTAGNVPVDVVTANNLAWLALCGRDDVPVHVGSRAPLMAELRTTEDTHGPLGVGYAELPTPASTPAATDAEHAWLDLTTAHPGEIVGLVTGPLTNLARAIRRDRELPSRLRRLVIMGGAFDHPGNTTPTAEWNIAVDPEAAAEVFAAFGHHGAPKPIVCPLDITETLLLTSDHLGRLAALADSTPVEQPSPDDDHGTRSVASHPLVRHVVDAMRFYFEFHADHDEGYNAHMHDPFAAAVAIDPTIATTRSVCVDVELAGSLTRATTVADERGFWGRPDNALIATSTDAEAFFDDLVTRVGTFIRDVPVVSD